MSWRTWHRSAVVLLCSLRDLAHETVDGARDVKAQKHRKNVPLTRVGGRDRRPALYSWCFAKQTLAQVKQNPFKSQSYARQGYRVRFTVYSLRYSIQISDNEAVCNCIVTIVQEKYWRILQQKLKSGLSLIHFDSLQFSRHDLLSFDRNLSRITVMLQSKERFIKMLALA